MQTGYVCLTVFNQIMTVSLIKRHKLHVGFLKSNVAKLEVILLYTKRICKPLIPLV